MHCASLRPNFWMRTARSADCRHACCLTILPRCSRNWTQIRKPRNWQQKLKGATSDSTANSNPQRHAEERPARRGCAGYGRAGRNRRRLLQDRFPPGAPGAQRLCAPVRTHDVPGLRKRPQNAAHQADQFERRSLERLHHVRRHQLLRSRSFQRARTRALAGSGSHARPESRRGKPDQPARRGERRSPRERAKPALRRLPLAGHAARSISQLGQCPQFLRRFCGSGRRQPRRRPEILPHLLRPQ
jgi:hypothetical protein